MFGYYVTILSLVLIVIMLDFGIGGVLVNKLSVLNDSNEQCETFYLYFTILVLITIPLLAVLSISPLIFDIDKIHVVSSIAFCGVMVLSIPFTLVEKYCLATNSWVLYKVCEITSSIVIFLIQYLILYYYPNLFYLCLSASFLFIIPSIFTVIFIYKKHNYILLKVKKFNISSLRPLFNDAKDFWLIQLSSMGINSFDTILVAKYGGITMAGYYGVLKKVFNAVQILQFFMKPFWPYFNRLMESSIKKAYHTFIVMLCLSLLINLIIMTLLISNLDLIYAYFFESNPSVPSIIVIGFVFYTFIQTVGGLLSPYMSTPIFLRRQRIILIISGALVLVAQIITSMYYSPIFIPITSFFIMLVFFVTPSYICIKKNAI